MTSDITSEIAQRLDVEPDVVGALLETTLQRIRQQVKHVGSARLDGLGTFRRLNDGLVFEPDPSLAEAINARFTGLHDLVLEPAGQERSAADMPLTVDEDDGAPEEGSLDDEAESFWNDREEREEPHPLGPESQPPYEDAEFLVVGDRTGDDEDLDATRGAPTVSWNPAGAERSGEDAPGLPASDEAAAGTAESSEPDKRARAASGADSSEDVYERAAAAEPEQDQEVPPAEPSAATSMEPSDEPSVESSASRPAGQRATGSDSSIRTTHPPSRRERERRDPKPIWFGVGIIVLVAASAVAIFLLSDDPQNAPVQETSQVEAPPAVPDPSPLAADNTAAAQDAEAPPSQPSSPFAAPLRSDDPVVPAAGGYTIVVYSETNQSLAEEEAARYREQGFRSGLLALEDGAARYRVAVGQFGTLEEAAQQRDEHAGAALPADSWVLRLNAQ